jgi:hypothetical protein
MSPVCPPAQQPKVIEISTKLLLFSCTQRQRFASEFILNNTLDGTKTPSTSMSFIIKFLLLLIISIQFESTLSFDDFLDQEDAFYSLHQQQQFSSTLNPPTLPPLISYVEYGKVCYPDGLLFKAYCNTYGRTVACGGATLVDGTILLGRCQCNLGDDAEFSEEIGQCVSKVGSLCFAQENALGKKVCVENADCFLDQEEEGGGGGHNVGKCKCLYGWKEDEGEGEGHCVPDTDVPEGERSTPRATTPFPTRPPPITTDEDDEDVDEGTIKTTTEDGDGGNTGRAGSNMKPSSWSLGIMYFIGILIIVSYGRFCEIV